MAGSLCLYNVLAVLLCICNCLFLCRGVDEMTRQETNRELVEHLILLIEEHPDQRFSQILQNYGFISTGPYVPGESPPWINEFYGEPHKILERVLLKTGALDE